MDDIITYTIINENASSSVLPMNCSSEEKCYSNNQATTEIMHFEHLERKNYKSWT